MNTHVEFKVPGEPQGKGRPRATTINGMARLYTPKKTASYEGLIAHAAALAMAGRPPLSEPVRLDIDIVCTVPASWSGKKRRQALAGAIRPAKKPDADNVVKAVCDGLNGVVWVDDVQAVEGGWRKVYGPTPGVSVRVQLLQSAQQLELAA